MRTWDKAYSGFFRKTLTSMEADEIESYLSSRNKGYNEGQLKKALELISLAGKYETSKPPLTEISRVLSRTMANEEIASLPDGCAVCRHTGMLLIHSPNSADMSLPCTCIKGDYVKEQYKPWCNYNDYEMSMLNKNIEKYYQMVKDGKCSAEKSMAETERRLDAQKPEALLETTCPF